MSRFAAALLVAVAIAAPAFAEIAVGDAAPDFTLKDQDGKDVTLSTFKGSKTVLVAFYPKDFSPGCTNEMKCLVKEVNRLAARDVVVLAISVDGVESHARFATTLGIQFRLLADVDLAVAKNYGVYVPSAGGAFATRSAFIIDKEGKLRWLNRDLKAPVGTLVGTDLLAELEKVAVPADPLAALADLPPAERDGKTAFVKFAQAFLGEQVAALDALVDPEACGRPGETPQMQRDRRKVQIDKWRTLFDKNDVKSLKFADVIDVHGSRVFTKETATDAALTSFGSEARAVAKHLEAGELLVVGRTSAPKLGDVQVLPREVVLRLKKSGETWKIVEVVS
jgi:peroxiredoxin Q/BCP